MNKWEELSPLEGEFNTEDDEGAASFSSDGKILYFTRCRSTRRSRRCRNLLIATFGRTMDSAEKHSIISKIVPFLLLIRLCRPTGSTFILFRIIRKALEERIFGAEKTDEGWGVPENLGNQINTEGNEMFPYVRYDGTLYFSSNGHVGFGGLDIYKATADSLGNWKVENMKSPINTLYDDFGITFEGQAERGFFSSNRNQSRGYDRIWSFDLPELTYAVEGKVTDEKGEALSDATIKVVGTDGQNVKMKTKKDGTFRIKLNPNTEYVMLASNRGYLNQVNKLTTQNLNQSKLLKPTLNLLPLINRFKLMIFSTNSGNGH